MKPKKAITSKSSSTALVPIASSSSQLCHLCEIVPCVLPPSYAERMKGKPSTSDNDSSLDD